MLKKKQNNEEAYSVPLKCLGCDLIVSLRHLPNANPKKDAWQCTTPNCLYIYKSCFWKVKEAKTKNTKIAVVNTSKPNTVVLLREAFERYKRVAAD